MPVTRHSDRVNMYLASLKAIVNIVSATALQKYCPGELAVSRHHCGVQIIAREVAIKNTLLNLLMLNECTSLSLGLNNLDWS
jgi:hypothetical protein